MKLAEALALRADIIKRTAQLQARVGQTARYQVGEEPAERAEDLLGEVLALVSQQEELVRRINKTNSATELEPGITLTDAIAMRDALGARREVITKAADAASGGRLRFGRNELAERTDLDVPALRRQADDMARQRRELDVRLQQANWSVDLLEV